MIISVKTTARTQLVDITHKINEKVQGANINDGLCMIFVPHTTAGVTINENADPDVKTDIETILNRMVPWEGGYLHLEGNSAAHVKSTLVGASELVVINDGKLVLGTWQGIYFCEFDGPRTRKVYLKFI